MTGSYEVMAMSYQESHEGILFKYLLHHYLKYS